MKKILFLIVALCCVSVAIGQESKQKVAVYVTGSGDAGINKVLGTKLVSEITRSGNYQAIERTSDFLKELQKEQGYQRSGNVDDNQISKLGKQFGVSLVCVADVTEVMGSKFLSSRLIDVETATVIATSDYMDEMKTAQDLVKAAESVASQLLGTTINQESTTVAEEVDNDGYANINVYRTKDGANVYRIELDGKVITDIGSNSKTTIKVKKEGNCLLKVSAESRQIGILNYPAVNLLSTIDVEFGKEYYIHVKWNNISRMDEIKGKKEFDKIK